MVIQYSRGRCKLSRSRREFRIMETKADGLIYRVRSDNWSSFSPPKSSWPWSTTGTWKTTVTQWWEAVTSSSSQTSCVSYRPVCCLYVVSNIHYLSSCMEYKLCTTCPTSRGPFYFPLLVVLLVAARVEKTLKFLWMRPSVRTLTMRETSKCCEVETFSPSAAGGEWYFSSYTDVSLTVSQNAENDDK